MLSLITVVTYSSDILLLLKAPDLAFFEIDINGIFMFVSFGDGGQSVLSQTRNAR